MTDETSNKQLERKQAVLHLLQKNQLVADVLHKQDMPHHDLVESLVRKQNLARMDQILEQMDALEIAQIFETLSSEEQLFIWDRLPEDRKELVLREVPLSVIQVLGRRDYKREGQGIKAFELIEGRLREVIIISRSDLIESKPIWVDLVNPTFDERLWVNNIFDIELPVSEVGGDLESSARFYVEENGDIHLRSDFLLDREELSRNVAVAFILHQDILFSIRREELPVFRLQRLRAFTQQNYVSDCRDVLLDLYAADVEYSADALEDVYRGLENVGKQVLSKQVSDDEAAQLLTGIAHEEDSNGRVRRNVLDTRRAVSFLMRSRSLNKNQLDDTQQILRDIESLDGHTAFLFDKINFLMDATVGFININQNKVIKQLTVLSVVFMPLNIIAGVGGMSEFSMMTQGIPWPVAYGIFSVGLVIVGWLTFELLRFLERRRIRLSHAAGRRIE
jgi:magnesium transporter